MNPLLSDDIPLMRDLTDSEPILWAIMKYENHPSILKIKDFDSTRTECFSFKPTNFESVLQEILALNPSKASPIESIPKKILKENYDILGFKISNDFNISVKTGTFPNNQKLADVSPIFKALDRHIKTNYRPVSILPALSKITEKPLFV